jgi:endonuclease/exonuclease/phosphatase (EEP) superfamily protein YafD
MNLAAGLAQIHRRAGRCRQRYSGHLTGFLRTRIITPAFQRTLGALALLSLLPSWLGLAGGWYWFLDLFANFRWQYLLASAAVICWAAWQRQRGVLLLATLTFMLNGFLIGQLAWQPDLDEQAPADDFSLRVLSQNVLMSNQDIQAVVEHVAASDADVVVLVETDQRWISGLAPLATRYPYRIEVPRADFFGIALLSRIPWTSQQVLSLDGLPAIQVRLHHQGHDLVVIGTHPMSPVGARHAAMRDRQLAMLASHVASLRTPALVIGDLNATPWSAGMRIAQARGLAYRSVEPPWQPTWSVRSPFAVPIDHALVTAPLLITQRDVGPDVGSDHRSLEVVARWAR